MPKVKYCVTEFTPTANQVGMSHSFNAKVVINSDIDGDTLAENEQYEDAKRMQTLITEQEQQAMKALHNFQKEFGDDVVKIEITKVGEPANEEED